MDSVNRFHTKETWLWVRAEHVAVILVSVVLVLLHWSEINWLRFIIAFAVLDLVGYIPGSLAYRRAKGGRISPTYHHLYNVTHSYLATGLLVGVWALLHGGFEWAMLAIPIHISGDRGLFGNTYKPVSLPFEPTPAPRPDGSAPDKPVSGEPVPGGSAPPRGDQAE